MSIYSDFRTNLDVHPIKKDLVRITDDQAVGRSLRNLILTAQYERFGNPMLGCGLRALLFENPNIIVADLIRDVIYTMVKNHDPRANTIEIYVNVQPDSNSYSVTIAYSTINNITPVKIQLLLERIR